MKHICKILALSGPLVGAAPLVAFAQGEGGRYYHGPGMMWDGGMGGFGMFFGFIFTLLILAAVIGGIVWAVRYLGFSGNGNGSMSRNTALDILKERYARGEIDSKEFEERRRLLSD